MKLDQVWKYLLGKTEQESEPQVHQRCNIQGNCYYHIYDPKTRKSSAFGSEQEVRLLLDQQRY